MTAAELPSYPPVDAFAEGLTGQAITWRRQAFKLRAGGESNWYVDVKQGISDGEMLQVAGGLLVAQVAELEIDFDVASGMGVGGSAVLNGVAFALNRYDRYRGVGLSYGNDSRDEAQRYGHGLHGAAVDGQEVWPVDDVATTGDSLITLVEMIRENGGSVHHASTIVDRGHGVAHEALAEIEVELHALLSFDEEEGLLRPAA